MVVNVPWVEVSNKKDQKKRGRNNFIATSRALAGGIYVGVRLIDDNKFPHFSNAKEPKEEQPCERPYRAFCCPVQGKIMATQDNKIVSLATDREALLEIDSVNPSTGEFKQIVSLDPNMNAGPGIIRNDNTALLSNLNPPMIGCLVTVDLSTGKVQQGKNYSNMFFNSLGFDKSTSQTFVVAGKKTSSSQLYELLPDQSLRAMTEIPGSGQLASTYSSSKHIFFMVNEDNNNLISVSTTGSQQGTILYNVPLPFQVRSMAFDDTFGVLYVWGATSKHSMLVSVDYTTGKPIKNFYDSTDLLAGAMCIDKSGTVAYSSVLSSARGQQLLVFTLNLSSGRIDQALTNRFAMAMNCQ